MTALQASNQTNLNNYSCNSFMKYSNICNLSIVKVFATFFFFKVSALNSSSTVILQLRHLKKVLLPFDNWQCHPWSYAHLLVLLFKS